MHRQVFGRMSHTGRRALQSIAGVFLMVGLFVASAPAAQADPHAMFYTAIGQRQLFFNVLAALDQADYVEPKGDSIGTPASDSRDELVERRDTADQSGNGSLQDVVEATETELSGVLTRLITLDGADLWTAYIAFQIAKEVDQANASDGYISVLCQVGLGRDDCENAPPITDEEQLKRKQAFNVDPQERDKLALEVGVGGVLRSSTSGSYQDLVNKLNDEEDTNPASSLPLPWSATLAGLRQQISSDAVKVRALERLVTAAGNAFLGSFIDATPFGNLNINESNGDIRLVDRPGESAAQFADRYTGTIAGLLDLSNQALGIASQGAQVTGTHLAAVDVDGAQANVDTRTVANGQGRVSTIKSPAYAKIEQVAAAVNQIGRVEGNPQWAPAEAELIPGDTTLVERAGNASNVAGATTQSSILGSTDGSVAGEQAGQVLHAVTGVDPGSDTSSPSHHDPKPVSLDLNTNPAAAHHERAPQHILEALGVDDNQGGCGCHLAGLLNDVGANVIEKINDL